MHQLGHLATLRIIRHLVSLASLRVTKSNWQTRVQKPLKREPKIHAGIAGLRIVASDISDTAALGAHTLTLLVVEWSKSVRVVAHELQD